MNGGATDRPLWAPSSAQVARAQVTAFARAIAADASMGAPAEVADDHEALWRWSVAHPERFWPAVWRWCDVVSDARATSDSASASSRPNPHAAVATSGADAPWTEVVHGLDRMAPPDASLGPCWFTGARLNFAENLLRHRGGDDAVVSWDETGRRAVLSRDALADGAARFAAALRAMGVGPGDRVAGFLPNIPQAIVAMLGAASVGATWSSCSPDFGAKGVLDRFGQIAPCVLVAADGYRYAGKVIDCRARVREIVAALPSVERVVVVPWLGEAVLGDEPVSARAGQGTVSPDAPDAHEARGAHGGHARPRGDHASPLPGVPMAVAWDDYVRVEAERPADAFARLPFDHPLYVMYSSGTTGLPKCLVHGAGRTLLQHLKVHVLHGDLRAGDRIFYFTTCGWMMWNWLVSALAVGATVVLYDGAPLAPDAAQLWRMAEAERLTVFGTSAKYLALLEKEGVRPHGRFDLDALEVILSTGSPLAAHSYDFVYRDIKPGVRLSSISGGTDLISCFALGSPVLPVHRGELQTRGLGMAVDVWRDDGTPAASGELGELVCTRPFPSMPVAFWGDAGGAKYRAAYFETFPNTWRHGDWAAITEHHGLVIHGRSDATLNPGGVRIGTAEIYRQVEQLAEVVESLVVGQEIANGPDVDTRVVLFVRLRDGVVLDDALKARIRQQIRKNTSPHHVPRVIVAVADIPRTISGKITELAVREVIHGRPVKNTDALANPGALDLFRDLPELAS
ncbi:MAG: acetoacetate--CoA ligase [Gemmatimonadetes bacterium]|nr:acetoacetate--CoA ligase [Gemmatimonadota bacterium]